MSWQRVKIEIPKGYKPRDREAIADEIIDFIVERTQSGKDKNNRSFPGYSKAYKNNLDFKIAGKTSKVDLTLSGDMLSSLEVISHKNGEITVGFDRSDSENNDKATGHITGIYGNSSRVKKRDFLGIAKIDLRKKILSNYPLSDRERLSERVEEQLQAGDDE